MTNIKSKLDASKDGTTRRGFLHGLLTGLVGAIAAAAVFRRAAPPPPAAPRKPGPIDTIFEPISDVRRK